MTRLQIHIGLVPCLLVGALAVTACHEGPHASASADPDGAHAEAKAHADDEGHGAKYDETKVSRTGVYIDPKIAEACGVEAPKAFFAFDSSEVPQDDRGTLDHVASCLSTGALKGQEVVLVGHTDPRGTDQYNKELGKSRADSVADYLREHGVQGARIEAESHGEDDASADESGWPWDRRVDVMLGKAGKE